MSKYPIYRYDIEQNTDEWLDIKLGMFSASSASDLLMTKSNKGYINLINRITEERITNSRCENNLFKGNWATDRGHELEPIARDDYEIRNLVNVKLVGVVIMDEWTLCSPDGLIDDNGIHQIKCPIFSTQNEYLAEMHKLKTPISGSYYNQLQFELMVTNREYNILTYFHPSLPPIDIKIERDTIMIEQIRTRLEEAKTEVLNKIEIIKNY